MFVKLKCRDSAPDPESGGAEEKEEVGGERAGEPDPDRATSPAPPVPDHSVLLPSHGVMTMAHDLWGERDFSLGWGCPAVPSLPLQFSAPLSPPYLGDSLDGSPSTRLGPVASTARSKGHSLLSQ